MNTHEKNVKFVEEVINSERDEPVELEVSMMIQDVNGVSKIFPGVQLNVPGVDMPIFIASGELKMLAEASEKYCADLIENQKKSKASPVKKKKS